MSENKENKELRQMIRQRSSLKARLTLFKSYVEDLKQMETDNDIVDEVLIELRQRLEKQERLVDEFEKIQAEIEQLNEDDDENMKERELFEKAYYSSNSSAKCVLNKFSKKTTDAQSKQDTTSTVPLENTSYVLIVFVVGILVNNAKANCRTCKAKHHTLLHINKNEDTADVAVQGTPFESMQSVALSAHTLYNGKPNRQVLLSTAIVNVIDNGRNVHKFRVILDSASESNIITREMCDLLGLEKSRIELGIVGINQEIIK
ncbi:hypothetical protein ILUMI_16915, partial [Ignelater luminosus]